MTSQQFIKGQIDSMVSKFPFIKCRYQFDELEDTHYVEVIPKGYTEKANSITELQNEIILNFIDKFPDQLLAFFSDGGLIELDEIHYEKAGLCYQKGIAPGVIISNSEVELTEMEETVVEDGNWVLAA